MNDLNGPGGGGTRDRTAGGGYPSDQIFPKKANRKFSKRVHQLDRTDNGERESEFSPHLSTEQAVG